MAFFEETVAVQKHAQEKPAPIALESPFEFNELFFSTTNPESVIEKANSIFVRVSKYDREEITGQFHSIIRHPDMPKAAFRILWEHILAKKAVAVYVKNLAKDGSFYWVLALVFPCNGGYLSIRLKPGSALFNQVKTVYKEVLAYEKELTATTDRESLIQASKAYLLKKLTEHGFGSYNTFMKSALRIEMHHRELQIQRSDKNKVLPTDPLLRKYVKMNALLNELVMHANSLHAVHGELMKHSDKILQLSRSILNISINTQLQAAKLDKSDQSLSVVAEKMGEQSIEGTHNLNALQKSIQSVSELFGSLNFNVISSKLQLEMTEHYMLEHTSDSSTSTVNSEYEQTVQLLNDAFIPRLRRVNEYIQNIPSVQNSMQENITRIERFTTVLRFIYITGQVEITRVKGETLSFMNTFKDLLDEITNTETHLNDLKNVLSQNGTMFNHYTRVNEQLQKLCHRISG